MKKIDVISFHPGRQHNFEQAHQLSKGLKSFKHLTSLYFSSKIIERSANFLPRLSNSLKKRSFEMAGGTVDTNPVPELKLLMKKRLGRKIRSEHYIDRNRSFQNWVLNNYQPPKVCIGYDTSSWSVFEKWKGSSLLVLDLSIAMPQYKLKLAKQYRMSENFIHNITEEDVNLYSIYEKEAKLADLILCGSKFVKDSCLSFGVDESKSVLLPYGVDMKRFFIERNGTLSSDKIKVAFIGSVSLRKGADLLLAAWTKVSSIYPEAELHFYGEIQMNVPSKLNNVFFHGFVKQNDLISDLKSAQISILPTFFEGSSLAIYQSMAMGLAVITTENAGSVIRDQHNGIIIPYGSEDAIVDSLILLMGNYRLRMELIKNAQKDVQKYTWDNYGDQLLNIIRQAI